MTPCHSQPQQTAAPTAFSRPTPDPTVHHVPVIWILVLADRVEKTGQGEKRGGGDMKASLHWGVHYVTKWQACCEVRYNVNSRRARFHKKPCRTKSIFHLVAGLSSVLIPFDFQCDFSVYMVMYPWQVKHVAQTQTQNTPPLSIYLMFELVSWHHLFQKWKGTIWSCHWPL